MKTILKKISTINNNGTKTYELIPVTKKQNKSVTRSQLKAIRAVKIYVSLGIHKDIPKKEVKKDSSGKIIKDPFYSKTGTNAINEYRKIKQVLDSSTTSTITLPNGFLKKVKIKQKFRELPSMKLTAEEREARMKDYKLLKSKKKLLIKSSKDLTREEQLKASTLTTPIVSTNTARKTFDNLSNSIVNTTIINSISKVKKNDMVHEEKIAKIIASKKEKDATTKKVTKAKKAKAAPTVNIPITRVCRHTLAEKMKEHKKGIKEDFFIITSRVDSKTGKAYDFATLPFNGTKIEAMSKGKIILIEESLKMKDIAGVQIVSKDKHKTNSLNFYYHSPNNFKSAA